MSEYVSAKRYAFRDSINSDDPALGRKSDFWRTFQTCLESTEMEKFIGMERTGCKKSIVHVDVINMVYHPSVQLSKCLYVSECMLQTVLRKVCDFATTVERQDLSKIYFHCDSNDLMIKTWPPINQRNQFTRLSVYVLPESRFRYYETDLLEQRKERQPVRLSVLVFVIISWLWRIVIVIRATANFLWLAPMRYFSFTNFLP